MSPLPGEPEPPSRPDEGTLVIRDAIAIGATTGVFGLTFGVLAVSAGLTAPQAIVMSLLVFTGGSQFAAIGVIDSGGSPVSAVGSALLLSARNGLYGVALAPIVGGGRLKRVVAAQLVIDESTAMAVARGDRREAERAFWWAGLSVFAFWNAGTAIGAIGGGALGDPASLGLDAALPAGFLALMAPALRTRPGRVAALVGGTIALVTIPLLPAGAPILAASLGVVVGMRVDRS